MKAALRAAMIGLVLLNLGFVALVEVASWTWLGPLFLLTVCSPLLVRAARFMTYRAVWNLTIVGAFLLLALHVRRAGVAYLLEDGLLLAALSQVHLICNLRDDQKPDLLFFNSFIIAVVTSYLTPDFAYLMLFLAYAPVLVLGLQLLVLVRAGATGRGMLALAMRQGAWRGLVLLVLTLAVFFLWPRDFTRRGLIEQHLSFSPRADLLVVDFNEEVELGRKGSTRQSDRVVLRVELRRGHASQVPAYWRGATQDHFDGRRWTSSRHAHADAVWHPGPDGEWWRTDGLGDLEVEVERTATRSQAVFAPLESRRWRPIVHKPMLRLRSRPDLTLQCATGGLDLERYRLTLRSRSEPRSGETRLGRSSDLWVHLSIDPSTVPPGLLEQARTMLEEFPDGADQHRVVEGMRQQVMGSHRYRFPGTEDSAASLQEFLEHPDRGGHCEYFATALTLMLRWNGIPCRMVTGYRSEEWDGAGRTLLVRARHAHAWVEVYDPTAGWYTVDPTPAVDPVTAAGPGLMTRLRELAGSAWALVTGFNQDARRDTLAWLRQSAAAVASGVIQAPLRVSWMVALAGAFVVVVYRRRRLAHDPAVASYRRTLRRLGLTLQPGETPRELLERAGTGSLDQDRVRELGLATLEHERARYQSS